MARMILGCLLIMIIAMIAYTIWKLSHSHGSQKRRPSKRHSFSNDQKRTIKQAQVLWNEGDVHGSVSLLESINMHVEASSLLESKGQTRDAGLLLIRSGYQQRGATLLEKNEHWLEATQAYRALGQYIKEGQCAQKANLFTEAALAFSAGQAHLEAGICFMQAQQPSQAAAAFLLAGETQHWLEAMKYLAEHAPDQYRFNRLEFSWFLQLADQLPHHQSLLKMLDQQDILVSIILNRLEQQDFDVASLLFENYKHRKSDLIARVDFESKAAETLSKVLLWSGEYETAGILYQQRSDFEKAASAFKQAGNEKRYHECLRLSEGFTAGEDGQNFSLSSVQETPKKEEPSSEDFPSTCDDQEKTGELPAAIDNEPTTTDSSNNNFKKTTLPSDDSSPSPATIESEHTVMVQLDLDDKFDREEEEEEEKHR